jgi:hypothetical protein
MKKLFTILIASFFTCSIFGQDILNGTFSSWSGNKATSWGTLSAATLSAISLEEKDSVQYTSAPYSMKIKTDSILLGPDKKLIQGFAVYGDIKYSSGISFYGTPFTFKPDTLQFSYKYTTLLKDTAYYELDLSKWIPTGDSAQYALSVGFNLDTTSTFKTVKIPLTSLYDLAIATDTAFLFFTSSKNGGQKGSTLWIDDVRFGYTSATTSIDGITPISSVAVYPNPAKGWVNIRIAEEQIGGVVQITDMAGREVSLVQIDKAITTTNISTLESGFYIVSVRDDNGNLIAQSKLSVI